MPIAEPLARIDEFLARLGYDSAHTEHDYPVWIGPAVLPIDRVAFGFSEPHDMTTALLTAIVRTDEKQFLAAMRGAQALTAPAMIVSDAAERTVELWAVGDRPVHRETVGWDDVAVAGRLAEELSPRRMLDAKRSGRQLGLFAIPAEELRTARESTVESLAGRVASAIGLAQGLLDDAPPRDIARLTIGAMAMLMVRDKLYGDEASPGLETLAPARFPNYFGWIEDLQPSERAALAELVAELGEGINYRGLDPRLISDVYEYALVDKTARKSLSVFYTPPDIARSLVAATPFELVPPEDRTVVDLACGSGTLLVAAHDRLRAIAPARMDFEETHGYLTTHLIGFDVDPFAVEIARLSLLLAALPIGNSWRIEQQDTGAGSAPSLPPVGFVVSNPPWESYWTRDQDPHAAVRREDVAKHFVRAAADFVRDGGYLSLLLPASLFEQKNSATFRTWLDRETTVLEATRLPEDTFSESQVETAAVILQKGSGRRRAYGFRRVMARPGWRDRALPEPIPEISVLSDENWLDEGLLARGPLDGAKCREPTLMDVADVHNGAVATPGFSPSKRETGEFLWLSRSGEGRFLAAVTTLNLKRTTYPAGFNWTSTTPSRFLKPKVLVSAVRSPSNPWRLKVLVDDVGVIPSHSLHYVAPRLDAAPDLDALAAYMVSAPVAAWIDQQNASRSIRLGVLQSVPSPLDDSQWAHVSDIGRTLRRRASAAPLSVHDDLLALDALVMDAWGLAPAAQSQLRHLMSGFRAPEGGARYEAAPALESSLRLLPPKAEAVRLVAPGAVLDIQDSLITLWVAGVTPSDGTAVTLPRRFPGALLYRGATFDCAILGEDLQNAEYRFQPQSWKDEHDMFDLRSPA